MGGRTEADFWEFEDKREASKCCHGCYFVAYGMVDGKGHEIWHQKAWI
jgi:hypothetical protein